MKDPKTIKLLLNYLRGKTTLAEKAKVDKWYDSISDANSLSNYSDSELSEIKEQLYQNIRLGLGNKVIPLYKQSFFKVAAAAVLIFSVSGIYWASKNTIVKPDLTSIKPTIISAPAENYATITLANGQKLELKGNDKGTIAQQESMQLVKLANGQIEYKGTADSKSIEELQYNTLTNPKGSKVINLTLSDGSKVWLNSGSALTYPVAFVSDERKVTITGEAYFEVAHDIHKPFKVAKGDLEIKVLGTHFNVNAYDDDSDIKITLLEGSVKVLNGNVMNVLKPGQQAQVTDEIKINPEVNMDEVMAWKNGYFYFNRADVSTVMRYINRWYGVEIIYSGPVSTKSFEGELERNLNLTQVIKILERNGLHLKQEGNKLIVLP
ncbi:FecR family protein [Solitalea lacus]|uniref:FecR family protein n=1 Tax=Solitalea lacus TaxID=2911172 RepID=UPI001EDAE9A2|nr:FecR family protein [Solitalea lacus]UKJ06935.1 FecR domain-containing protein [Solitalea lacus]